MWEQWKVRVKVGDEGVREKNKWSCELLARETTPTVPGSRCMRQITSKEDHIHCYKLSILFQKTKKQRRCTQGSLK